MDYMKNILEELYRHDICPEYFKRPDTPEYSERLERSSVLEEKLLAILSGEEKEIYTELRENLDIIFDLEMMQCFVTGYMMASQIMIDVAVQMNNPKMIKMRNIVKKSLHRKEPQEGLTMR